MPILAQPPTIPLTMPAPSRLILLLPLFALAWTESAGLALARPNHPAPSPASPTHPRPAPAGPRSKPHLLVDVIVATVDSTPITLSDVGSRLAPQRSISLAQLTSDPDARIALEELIAERLLEEEAKTRRITVTDPDIESYLDEVAQRNGLSRRDFEVALQTQGQTLPQYRQQVRLDILRTRLVAAVTRGGVSVTDAEVDQYLASHPDASEPPPPKPPPTPHDQVDLPTESVTLRRIEISTFGRGSEAALSRGREALNALERGESFSEVAKRFSDAKDAADGGLLGVVNLRDLDQEVRSAIDDLRPGAWSSALESPERVQIFFVEARTQVSMTPPEPTPESTTQEEEEPRKRARQALQAKKTREKLAQFFETQILKNHAVDKKFTTTPLPRSK